MRTQILVIDDEEDFRTILRRGLEREGYEVDTADSAETALGMDLSVYQLMIVDIMMERLSGFDFAKRVRNNPEIENIPIIFCSALNAEDDMVMGLNIGADDYVTKPFTMPEVVARVKAVLRRTGMTPKAQAPEAAGPYEPDIVFRTLRLDRNNKSCFINGEKIDLTPREYNLLHFFLTHRERIHSRDDLMNEVFGQTVTPRAIDTNITRLRKKLGQYGNNIQTKLGFGYGFKAEP